MQKIQVGSAISESGSIVYGQFKGVDLPTGGSDDLPVIITQGKEEGPCLWITGSIHGNEYSGLSTILSLLGVNGRDFPLDDLSGTVVMMPTLSPAGLRTSKRSPYYNDGADPNRMFPDAKQKEKVASVEEEEAPYALEEVYERLFDAIVESADFLLDLHDAVIGSMPFSFRDPIYYWDEADKVEAAAVMAKTDEMLAAFGMPILNEFPSKQYLDKKLHRSVSGAVYNKGRIPAFTVELGGYDQIDSLARDAAVIGCRNVMRWAGMLSSPKEAMPPIPMPQVDFPVRRKMHPRIPQAGILHYLVDTGDVFKAGDAVARLTDIWGCSLGEDEGLLRSEHDGYIVGLLSATVAYKNMDAIWMAIRDDSEMLLPYPTESKE